MTVLPNMALQACAREPCAKSRIVKYVDRNWVVYISSLVI